MWLSSRSRIKPARTSVTFEFLSLLIFKFNLDIPKLSKYILYDYAKECMKIHLCLIRTNDCDLVFKFCTWSSCAWIDNFIMSMDTHIDLHGHYEIHRKMDIMDWLFEWHEDNTSKTVVNALFWRKLGTQKVLMNACERHSVKKMIKQSNFIEEKEIERKNLNFTSMFRIKKKKLI